MMRDAGAFGAWLDDMDAVRRGVRDADVPCDGCTACCESSQFVHVERDEADSLAHIPAGLLFPAPGGGLLLGHDADGRCPMLVDRRCSIYDHRPRACRMYDCRVYAAADIVPDDKPLVAVRVRAWRFAESTPEDRAAHDAVRRSVPLDGNPLQRALVAVGRGIDRRGETLSAP